MAAIPYSVIRAVRGNVQPANQAEKNKRIARLMAAGSQFRPDLKKARAQVPLG